MNVIVFSLGPFFAFKSHQVTWSIFFDHPSDPEIPGWDVSPLVDWGIALPKEPLQIIQWIPNPMDSDGFWGR